MNFQSHNKRRFGGYFNRFRLRSALYLPHFICLSRAVGGVRVYVNQFEQWIERNNQGLSWRPERGRSLGMKILDESPLRADFDSRSLVLRRKNYPNSDTVSVQIVQKRHSHWKGLTRLHRDMKIAALRIWMSNNVSNFKIYLKRFVLFQLQLLNIFKNISPAFTGNDLKLGSKCLWS